jgi:hypothetical protein
MKSFNLTADEDTLRIILAALFDRRVNLNNSIKHWEHFELHEQKPYARNYLNNFRKEVDQINTAIRSIEGILA